jgi:F-type H+-transporting ATPase subunit epsilon
MAKLKAAIVTPLRQVVRTEVDMVTAPSVLGEVGILVDHLPLLADMYEGPVGFKVGDKMELYAVSGGFIEVDRNSVTILAETAEHVDEIDVKRSKKALEEAEELIKTLDTNTEEYQEEWNRAQRARTRLQVAGE